LLPEGL